MKLKCIFKSLCLPVLAVTTLTAHADQAPWLVRGRIIDVVPFASSNNINIINGKVSDVSSKVVPELDLSYFITPHIAAELILATSRHNVKAKGTVLGTVNLGDANILPPTLTLQYHFLPEAMINPYIGAGINYTYFYNVSKGPLVNAITYANSFGPALQIGADVMINKSWSINIDAKKVYVQTNVDVDTPVGHLSPTVRLNPIIFGLGVGYRFCL